MRQIRAGRKTKRSPLPRLTHSTMSLNFLRCSARTHRANGKIGSCRAAGQIPTSGRDPDIAAVSVTGRRGRARARTVCTLSSSESALGSVVVLSISIPIPIDTRRSATTIVHI